MTMVDDSQSLEILGEQRTLGHVVRRALRFVLVTGSKPILTLGGNDWRTTPFTVG
jgi:hypothetical protein